MSHKPQPHLLLHNIIGSLSYWGTTVRTLLIAFVLGVAVLAHVIDAASLAAMSGLTRMYLYIVGCLFLLDAGYVTIARATPATHKRLDNVVLLFALAVLSIIATAPYFVEVANDVFRDVMVWLFAVVLFILSARLVVGVLSGRK